MATLTAPRKICLDRHVRGLYARSMKRLISSSLIVAALVLPIAARADTQPHATSVATEILGGVVASLDAKFTLTAPDNPASLAPAIRNPRSQDQDDGGDGR